jgi:translation initiation factor IF-2
LSSKKRVHDLAKEYGMTGKEFVAKLHDLGFADVKSHMSALDEFKVLEIRGRLEAYGIVAESSERTEMSLGGLKLKRKKKKKKTPAEETPKPPAAVEPEPAPAAEEPPAEVKPEPAPEAAEPEPATEVAEADVQEVASPEVEPTAEPEPAVAAQLPAEEPAPTVETSEELAPAAAAEAETEVVAEAAEAPTGEAPATEGAEAAGEEVVQPSAKRRAGKVVGFIDPSQFQQAPKSRPQSRRLASRDDVVPNVMPTFGRDRSSGFVRGDTTRGNLTAQQLREKEQGRFLRRRRAQQSRTPGGRGAAAPRPTATGSPYAGQTVQIDEPISIKKLANTLSVSQNQVLRLALRELGFGININSLIDAEAATLLAHEFEVDLDVQQEIAAEEALVQELDSKRAAVEDEHLIRRPPTVAFLGHVDHGKTTLIDSIRTSRITSGESGGITQHIGAYQVTNDHGHTLAVLDTPGHEAFTAMRARGASAVDVVVLVVAADDGVKPQTEEAYAHAKAAGTPLVVALNKMDRPEANREKVLQELGTMGITPEDWGGETAVMNVSALNGDGIEDLLERVFLESEILELDCHPDGIARGVVLEAMIEQGKGKVAHLLVQDGLLKRGDVILAGEGYGKVRALHDDHGKQIQEAGPSVPVEVTGLGELPMAGDNFYVVDSLDRAQEVAEERARKNRQMAQVERRDINRENLLEAVADSQKSSVNLIVKSDVQGSAEVLRNQLETLEHEEVTVKLIHVGVGAVLESDVDLAMTSDATILAFHVPTHSKVRHAAERAGVVIRNYEVIYELLDDVKRFMEGELAPELKEEVAGHAEVRRVFKSSKFGNIAGCMVIDGLIKRSHRARVHRDGELVYEGAVDSLRREKDNAKEVREGFECGILLKDFDDFEPGDVIEGFRMIEVKRTL